MSTRLAIRLAAACAALAALPAAPAHAVVLQCGDTVTQDTRLTADVGPCPANTIAVTVSGANAALDLHGHRIIGADTTGLGVDVNALGVTVTNGRIENFGIGVQAGGGGTVSRLRITGSLLGVLALGANDVTITRNRISGVSGGIENDFTTGDQITRNTVRDCANGFVSLGTGGGDVWSRNLVTDCTTDGFNLFDTQGDELTDNRALRNGRDGFNVRSLIGTTTLTKNRAEDNGDDGIDSAGVIDGGRNRAKRNADQQCVGVICRS